MHKKGSTKFNKHSTDENSSCDVSQSLCEDSLIQEETSIAQKIKSVACHNNQSIVSTKRSDSLQGQLSGIIQQIDGLLLPK